MDVDLKSAERAITEFLRALGYDPGGNPELRETPARVARAFADELLSGYQVDIEGLVRDGSIEGPHHPGSGIVLVREIAVATLCPHHLMPSLGTATVAYLPGARLLGVGTLARLVDAYARRLSMQESLGQNVVDALMRYGGALGAYCKIGLVHGCLSARGAGQSGADVHTVATAGELSGGAAAVQLRLALCEHQ